MTGRATRSAAVVLAVTLQRLVEDATRFWSVEEQLVLDALRRSANALNHASPTELKAYVVSLEPEALQAALRNVKGIYHELLFAYAENVDGDEVAAQLFQATNHAGADLEFYVDGDSVGLVQLKAVESASHITEHLTKYPDIAVRATDEVASALPGIESSGFANAALTSTVADTTADLRGDSIVTEAVEGVASSALVTAAFTAGETLRRGTVSRTQLKMALGDTATAGFAAIVLDVLIGDVV
ncbi:hypothetical protein CKO28_18480 [Rhodovibrio sodomensis]|uniref:Uncharacterized protein n=1 Tax=Rhodovibrio sodomensis TaxID=1088 RepID=A0ABS1DJT4_9PROT|nr:hypothetical protein [Rhodovibrio sodomensis]MBK1670024.1 hypothetical protein [Rhodovibrio sodomensis]